MMGDNPENSDTETGPGRREAKAATASKPAKPADRRTREAAALRANLAKRKAFQRARKAGAAGSGTTPSDGADRG